MAKRAKKKSTRAASSGAAWNSNNLACVNTWAFLRGLGQLTPSFEDSEGLTMSQLAFWSPVASAESRRLEAKALAANLDNIYRKALLAKLESGFTVATAVNTLAEALANSNKTVGELALVVDEIYNFRGEVR